MAKTTDGPRAYRAEPKTRAGRHPRAKEAATRVVAIRLTETELVRWQRAAGDVPVAVWAREQCEKGLR